MRLPVDNFETQFNTTAGNRFGQKITSTYWHSGADINGNSGGNTDCGTPLKAITNGIISSVIYQVSGYGNHLHLRFEINGKPYWAHYCHCQIIYVQAGQQVREGDIIARLGNSGNSNYCHLHFEIKNQPTGVEGIARTQADLKKWEDPIPFIKKIIANPTTPLTPLQKEQKIRFIFGQTITSTERLKQSDVIIHA